LSAPEERTQKFGQGFANIETFPRLCEEIIALGTPPPVVRIHGVGEPALWHDLGDSLRICANKGLKTWLFTVGIGNSTAEFINAAQNASIVEFSINAFTRDEFRRTKGMDAYLFDQIVENIRQLANVKQKRGMPRRILVSRVESHDKVMDREFVTYWSKSGLVDDAFIRTFHDYGARIPDKFALLLDKPETRGCLVPNARMNIDAVLGVVVRCFNELFDNPVQVRESALASLFGQASLRDIWGGSEMMRWRANPFAYPQCANCRSCQPPNPNTSERQLEGL